MQLVLTPLPLLRRFIASCTGAPRAPFYLSREISPRETVKLSPKQPLLLRCGEGSIWITGGGDAMDIVLQGGEQIQVTAGSLVIIEALRLSRLEVSTAGR